MIMLETVANVRESYTLKKKRIALFDNLTHTSNFIEIKEGNKAFIKYIIKDRLCYVKST